MKGIKAGRVKFNIGNLWESAVLHVLFTKEDDVVVARCLDFTVSSHGKDEEDALRALAGSLKEYILTAVENDAIDTIFDSAHSKFWRMYNELETNQSIKNFKMSIKKSFGSVHNDNLRQLNAGINYA